MGGGGSVNTDPGPASEALASIARDQFADWWKRYRPMTIKLTQEIQSPSTLARDLGNASKTIGGQFSEQRMATERGLSRMGVTPTAPQQELMTRQNALAQAGLDAAARTSVRRMTRERGTDVIGGF